MGNICRQKLGEMCMTAREREMSYGGGVVERTQHESYVGRKRDGFG